MVDPLTSYLISHNSAEKPQYFLEADHLSQAIGTWFLIAGRQAFNSLQRSLGWDRTTASTEFGPREVPAGPSMLTNLTYFTYLTNHSSVDM